MGLVYEATDVRDGSRAAIKVLLDTGSDDERRLLADLFDIEVEALRRMNHPMAARLFGEGTNPRWLAMPFFDGERLGDVLLRGPLPWTRVVTIAQGLCAALGAAHEKGIIHRDVKPSNVLLLPGDQVVLLDFGVARLSDRHDPTSRADPERVFGSPHTVAPEQVGRLPTDARTDVYGLGILMFRLLSGTWPYHGAGRRQTLEAHLEKRAPDVRKSVPDAEIPHGLATVVLKAMARMPEERFPSTNALSAALGTVANTDGLVVSALVGLIFSVLMIGAVWWVTAS